MNTKPVFLSPNIALVLILVVAAVLRFYEIGAESLWNDELSSWRQSDVASISQVLDYVRADVHPPGYQVFLYYSMKAFGTSETALRMPSAIAGVFAVLLIFFFGRRLWSVEAGLMSAALMAVSWSPIFYAQESRVYSLLMLATLACSYLYFELLQSLKKRSGIRTALIAGYVLVASICCYLHYFGLLLVALQGLVAAAVFIREPRAFAYVCTTFVLVLVLYLPWLPSMFSQYTGHPEFWIADPSLYGKLRSLLFFSFKAPRWFVYPVILPIFLLAIYWLVGDLRRFRRERRATPGLVAGLFAILWIAVPFLASYLQSKISTPVMTIRNLIIVVPAIYLMLAGALTRIHWPAARRAYFAIVLAASTYFLIGYNGYYDTIKKQQFREATQYVLGDSDGLPVVAYTWGDGYFNYYFRALGSDTRVGVIGGTVADIAKVDSFLEKQGPGDFWFMAGHREPEAAFIEYLDDHYELIQAEAFFGASARKYRRQ